MPSPPPLVTSDMFLETKMLHNHHWKFIGGQTGGNKYHPIRIGCCCELCGTRHRVLWRNLIQGKSRCCSGCRRKLSPIEIEDFNEKLKRNESVYQLSGQSRLIKTSKYREYWVICGECNQGKWLQWNTLSSFRATRCLSCSMRKRMAEKLGRSYVPLKLQQPKKKKEVLPLLPFGNTRVG